MFAVYAAPRGQGTSALGPNNNQRLDRMTRYRRAIWSARFSGIGVCPIRSLLICAED
jgi:hypothetical protein